MRNFNLSGSLSVVLVAMGTLRQRERYGSSGDFKGQTHERLKHIRGVLPINREQEFSEVARDLIFDDAPVFAGPSCRPLTLSR